MRREEFRTPDEDVMAEFDRVCQLFQLALGKPSDRVLFDSLMGEASTHGMNWVEGLEYVVEQRRSGEDRAPAITRTAPELGKRPPASSAFPAGTGLRKAG